MRRLAISAVLTLSGCNLIFGLEDAEDRPGGGSTAGNAPGGEAQGAGGSGASDGGTDPSGGAGGGGGGVCPPEQPAGSGTELMPNGSFELGNSQWINSGLGSFTIVDEDPACGCSAARLVSSMSYAELRGIVPDWNAGLVNGRARVRASDLVDLELLLRVDDTTVEPPVLFANDDDDGVADGWRTAASSWTIPAGRDAFFVIVVTNPAPPTQIEIVADCVSLVRED